MADERIIAYLLGELPAAESEQFEDECFAQEHWPAQVHLAEEDLIDDYLRGGLTPEQRQHFEQYYLTTKARKERVVIAASLLRHVAEYKNRSNLGSAERLTETTWAERFRAFWGSRRWALRAALALTTIAVVVGGLLWLNRSPRARPQNLATLTLTVTSNSRAEGAPVSKVRLPPDADGLRIILKLPDGSPPSAHYRLDMENENGETRPLEITDQGTQSVSVSVPAAKLKPGEYALKLFATRDGGGEQRIPGSYYFIIE